MTKDAIVYRVFNMHGPTTRVATHDGYEQLVRRTFQASRNAGPYRIVYLPTGEVVARFDRSDNGDVRPGYDSIESALAS